MGGGGGRSPDRLPVYKYRSDSQRDEVGGPELQRTSTGRWNRTVSPVCSEASPRLCRLYHSGRREGVKKWVGPQEGICPQNTSWNTAVRANREARGRSRFRVHLDPGVKLLFRS